MAAKRFLTFDRLILIGGVIAALIVAFGPLFMDAWARVAWTEVPCHEFAQGDHGRIRFVFELHGKKWSAGRQNMWVDSQNNAVRFNEDVTLGPVNGTCWTNNADPPTAVRRLDTWQHLGDGLGNYVSGALVLVVCGAISIFGKPKQRALVSAPPAGGGPSAG